MSREISILMGAIFAVACSSSIAPTPDQQSAQLTGQPADFADEPIVPELDGAPFAPVEPVAPEPAPLAAPQALAPAPAPAPAVVAPSRASLSCDISVKRTPYGVRVTPVVRSSRSVAGEYSLVITKIGSGGSSDIRQGGPFEMSSGREELGVSEFSLERNAKFKATLKVRANGREVCRDYVS
jgi:hypothetical protein